MRFAGEWVNVSRMLEKFGEILLDALPRDLKYTRNIYVQFERIV